MAPSIPRPTHEQALHFSASLRSDDLSWLRDPQRRAQFPSGLSVLRLVGIGLVTWNNGAGHLSDKGQVLVDVLDEIDAKGSNDGA